METHGVRRRPVRASVATVTVGAAVAVAVLLPGAGAAGGSAGRAQGPPTLVGATALPTGAVKREWSDGSRFVGNPLATVSFIGDADGKTIGMEVADPGPTSSADAARLAAQYQASGRSVSADATAAGIDPATVSGNDPQTKPSRNSAARANALRKTRNLARASYNFQTANVVYDSGCAVIDDVARHWQGCFRRKGTSSTDPDHYYLADASQAAGNAKVGGYWLTSGSTHHRYGNAELIVQWQPGSDIPGSDCETVSIGMSGYGVSFSDSFTRCPTEIHITAGTQNFDSNWQGCKGSQYTPGTAAETFTRVPTSGDATLFYSVVAAIQTSSC